MSIADRQADPTTDRIKSLLAEQYGADHPKAKIDVYRYNPAAVRIRIVDPDFDGKSRAAREDEVWAALEGLDERTVADITVCLLLTPAEQPLSPMNVEFEHPQSSAI